uniref:Uncharacterized protein n=1 Tax=Phytophthora ramorum TaxID=164328 RepID=H3HB85_PHYRM
MTKLLTTIQNDVEQLTSPTRGDVSHALAKVKKVQEKEVGVVTQSIECFDEAVAWLQRKLTMCHDTAATLLNVAPISASNKPTTMHVGATELALALMLQRVLDQYGSFLESCMFDLPVLEAFSQQVLGDFLEIWTHFVRQQQEKQQSHKTNGNLGFIVGVASATSPALRRLDVAVTNRLELQFFSLVDSRKCFDDVLESLVVKAKLPFALSGEVLRTIAMRHQRLPSVPRLLLALRFLLFTHFRRCPWSFLALAVDGLSSSGVSPILAVAKVCSMSVDDKLAGGWAGNASARRNWRSSFRAFGIFEADGDGLDSTLGELSVLCAYARTQKTPAKMLVALREELVAVFTGRLITALLDPSARRTVSPANTLVANCSVLTDANVLDERLRFEYHDNLRNVLQDAGIGEDIDSNKDAKAEASWVHDVGLAFLFYQENASASLSLHEWYESFSSELKEETKSAPKSKNKKRKAADVSDDAAIKARFVRAVCTLRHWGFIKSDAPRDLEQDIIEKLVFI